MCPATDELSTFVKLMSSIRPLPCRKIIFRTKATPVCGRKSPTKAMALSTRRTILPRFSNPQRVNKMNKPFIPMDSDPFIPGKPLHSTTELDELKRKYELSSPSQPGPRKQVADVIN